MKPTDLPKDKRDSVRINAEIDRALREKGLSVQKLLDWAIDKRIDLKTVMKIKKG